MALYRLTEDGPQSKLLDVKDKAPNGACAGLLFTLREGDVHLIPGARDYGGSGCL